MAVLAAAAFAVAIQPATAGQLCDSLRFELLEQSLDRTVVHLTWPEAANAPRAHGFAVAAPDARSPQVRVLELRTRSGAEVLTPAGETESTDVVAIGPPRRYREQWICGVTVRPLFLDESTAQRLQVTDITIEILHPARETLRRETARLDGRSTVSGAGFDQPAFDETFGNAYRGMCVNESAARAFRSIAPRDASTARRQDIVDVFEHSSNWLRLEIEATGLYAVTFADLSELLGTRGQDAELIRPETFRLFSAPHPYQPRQPEDVSGSWQREYSLEERALRVEAAGSSFAAGDRVFLYAPGPEEWSDRYDPSAAPLEHLEHEYADRLAYWLTWDFIGETPSSFGPPPSRMPPVDAAPTGTATIVREDHRARLHAEANTTVLYGAVPDNWAWVRRIETGAPRSFTFDVTDLVAGDETFLLTHGVGRARQSRSVPLQEQLRFNGGEPDTTFSWEISEQQDPATAPILLTTDRFSLVDGENTLEIANVSAPDTNGIAHDLVLDFFSLTYRRELRLPSGVLEWVVFESEVETNDLWESRITKSTGPWEATVHALDTSDPKRPRWLSNLSVTGDVLSFETAVEQGRRHHFLVCEDSTLRRPAAMSVGRPRLLRAEVRGATEETDEGYDMVILHPAEFRLEAQRMEDHRREELAEHASPRVTAVDLQDVYDQFGHGVKEPAAIRNYLKFLYMVDPRLEFAVLFGDASRDYRNRAGRDPQGPEIDRCPTFIQTQWPRDYTENEFVPYATDDWLGSFDDPPDLPGRGMHIDLPEIALGRLPAGSRAEASRTTQRIIDYDRDPTPGAWRNELLLAADDEVALIRPQVLERFHVEEAECIADFLLPPEFDIDKLYLTEYAVAAPGTRGKPAARTAMRRKWSEGKLIVHYIGHGSPEVLADEALFRIEDVPSLTNGDRLPLFLGLSCDVAIFDSPSSKSMTEQLILEPRGGIIAGIAATQVTFPSPNEDLTEAFYPRLYPEGTTGRSEPIGRALIAAKANVPFIDSPTTQHNNQKYVILGDPSLQLQSPSRTVEVGGDLSAAILSGRRQTVSGRIAEDGTTRIDLSGQYNVEAKESADSTVYVAEDEPVQFELPYVLDGGSFFRGTGSFSAGEFSAPLLPPAFMRFGQNGRIRILMESDTEMFVGVRAAVPVEKKPIDIEDDEPPRIEIGFQNNARQVPPGSPLLATIADESGINVLGTTPANSIQIEFDDNGFPVDATLLFELDDGEFTSGTLVYELPDGIPPGEHRVVLRASDMLNNLGSTELAFKVIEAGGIDIAGHAAFPNPFRESTRFVVEVTSPEATSSEVELTVFTVQGHAVRRLRDHLDQSGVIVLPWNGRDERGDEVGNGVYLYRIRATFGTDPALTETVVGRIVRMR